MTVFAKYIFICTQTLKYIFSNCKHCQGIVDDSPTLS